MQQNYNEEEVTENLTAKSPNYQDDYSHYTDNNSKHTSAKSSLRKYPFSTTLKITHLLIMDILNIVFCTLNSYQTGVIMHVVVTTAHILVFSSDIFL